MNKLSYLPSLLLALACMATVGVLLVFGTQILAALGGVR